MRIKFPAKAGGKFLESITACGRVKAKEFGGPSKSKRESVDIELAAKGIWYRLVASQASNGKDVHFHVDAAKLSEFGKANPPSKSEPAKSLDILFEQFANKKIEVVTTVRFAFPLSILRPDSVISVLLGVKVGPEKLSARLGGSFYEIDEGPILRVWWSRYAADGGGDSIVATFESIGETTIDDDYLENLVQPLHEAFKTLILEEGREQ